MIDVRYAAVGDGDDVELDEIVARSAAVHLERMDDTSFALGVDDGDESVLFSIYVKDGRIDAIETDRSKVLPGSMLEYRDVLQRVMQVLGPNALSDCEGCNAEIAEALRLIRTLGIEYRPRKTKK